MQPRGIRKSSQKKNFRDFTMRPQTELKMARVRDESGRLLVGLALRKNDSCLLLYFFDVSTRGIAGLCHFCKILRVTVIITIVFCFAFRHSLCGHHSPSYP